MVFFFFFWSLEICLGYSSYTERRSPKSGERLIGRSLCYGAASHLPVTMSVRQNLHKGHREDPFSVRLTFDVSNLENNKKMIWNLLCIQCVLMQSVYPEIRWSLTHPPLLVFFTRNNDHFSFSKGQLIIVICLAVVDGFHPLDFVLSLTNRTYFIVKATQSTREFSKSITQLG